MSGMLDKGGVLKKRVVKDMEGGVHIKERVDGSRKVGVMHTIDQSGKVVSIREVIPGSMGIGRYISGSNSMVGGSGGDGGR